MTTQDKNTNSHPSSIGSQSRIPITKRSPPTRGLKGNTDIWLKQMSEMDTALWGLPRPLWIVDNKMYDLTQFSKTHPGGSSWINYTKGQDISVLFKTHHLQQQKVRKILQKYYVGQCPIKQQPRFQFDKQGHFNEVRKRILSKYSVKQLQDTRQTQLRCSVIIIIWLALVAMCGYLQSYILAVAVGFVSMCHYGIGHLFLHRKDTNWFKHVYLLIGFSAKQQQILHTISHHPYCNTLLDYEYAALQPIMYFTRCLPPNRWYSPILLQILFITVALANIITKVIVSPIINRSQPSYQHVLTLLQIPYLYIFTGDWPMAIKLFIVMILSYGLFFGKMVLCPHRQDLLWSQGAQQIKDYVLHMIATTTDLCHQSQSYKSLILYSGFNVHILHHMFPTIDHSKLIQCNNIFIEYCKEKAIKVNVVDSMYQCNKRMINMEWKMIPFQIRNFIKL